MVNTEPELKRQLLDLTACLLDSEMRMLFPLIGKTTSPVYTVALWKFALVTNVGVARVTPTF